MREKMNISVIYFGSLLLILSIIKTCRADGTLFPTCKHKEQPISEIINSLSSRLETHIEGFENYIFSPLSISVALAMVYIGTRGATRDQMSEALKYALVGRNCLNTKVSAQFEKLMLSLENKEDNNSLLIANGVFIHRDYTVSEYYTSTLKQYFKSSVEFLNFAQEEIASMNKINRWVSDHTKGKISKLINEPLDPMTIMVLMNAVYFKGLWKHPFDENSTWKSFFYRKNQTSKIVPFMMLSENFNYYHDEKKNYSFLELDYISGNISMLLILPKNMEDFPQLALDSEHLCSIRNKFQSKKVVVVIPKFTIGYKRELSKDMIKLGMDELFSDRADLTGIREENDLHVSLMVHKAMIVVNEHGSEAAAISGVGIDGKRKVSQQETFWADHPFLFYIIDKRTDTILFAGRVADPQE